jgi:hypothetical protein
MISSAKTDPFSPEEKLAQPTRPSTAMSPQS